jgi:hypothetical protein
LHAVEDGSSRDAPATAGALNVSGAAESDADFARLEDHRHLTAAVGKLQHLGESVFVLEDV